MPKKTTHPQFGRATRLTELRTRLGDLLSYEKKQTERIEDLEKTVARLHAQAHAIRQDQPSVAAGIDHAIGVHRVMIRSTLRRIQETRSRSEQLENQILRLRRPAGKTVRRMLLNASRLLGQEKRSTDLTPAEKRMLNRARQQLLSNAKKLPHRRRPL